MAHLIRLEYRELVEVCEDRSSLPSLKEHASAVAQDNEAAIIQYLETAPNYSAMGKVTGDVLNPEEKVVLFPGTNTDGLYLWPAELAYYVRRYHVRLPP